MSNGFVAQENTNKTICYIELKYAAFRFVCKYVANDTKKIYVKLIKIRVNNNILCICMKILLQNDIRSPPKIFFPSYGLILLFSNHLSNHYAFAIFHFCVYNFYTLTAISKLTYFSYRK